MVSVLLFMEKILVLFEFKNLKNQAGRSVQGQRSASKRTDRRKMKIKLTLGMYMFPRTMTMGPAMNQRV